jgi:repressor LexA
MELSQRQRQVLGFIEKFTRDNGYPPTLRDIGGALGIRSTNAVNDHLAALERKGALVRDRSRSRGISLPGARPGSRDVTGGADDDAAPIAFPGSHRHRPDEPLAVPLVGRIAAGLPLLAEENLDGHVTVDSRLVRQAGSHFALRVTGDSMIGDGILDGDILVVRAQDDAPDGTIVVALVDQEATVKRIFREPHRLRLQPSNPDMEPILVGEDEGRSAVVQGVVVSVMRRLGGGTAA